MWSKWDDGTISYVTPSNSATTACFAVNNVYTETNTHTTSFTCTHKLRGDKFPGSTNIISPSPS